MRRGFRGGGCWVLGVVCASGLINDDTTFRRCHTELQFSYFSFIQKLTTIDRFSMPNFVKLQSFKRI